MMRSGKHVIHLLSDAMLAVRILQAGGVVAGGHAKVEVVIGQHTACYWVLGKTRPTAHSSLRLSTHGGIGIQPRQHASHRSDDTGPALAAAGPYYEQGHPLLQTGLQATRKA